MYQKTKLTLQAASYLEFQFVNYHHKLRQWLAFRMKPVVINRK